MTTKKSDKKTLSRRQFVQSGAAATVGLLLAACGESPPPAEPAPTEAAVQPAPTATAPPTATHTPQPAATAAAPEAVAVAPNTPTLEPTPQCDDHDETLAQTAGPFYTPDTPQRTSFLEPGINGTQLVVSGRVMATDCQPLAGAILDFWHADDNGQYDNDGYRLRGHQFTDENGAYRLETIVPGLYPGRTRHIHVIVQGQNTDLLTTQLYFPDEPQNQTDGIFHPALVMAVEDSAAGQTAAFDFVLA